MSVFLASTSVHRMYAWWPRRSDKDIESPGNGVTDGQEPCGGRELNPTPLQNNHSSETLSGLPSPTQQLLKRALRRNSSFITHQPTPVRLY